MLILGYSLLIGIGEHFEMVGFQIDSVVKFSLYTYSASNRFKIMKCFRTFRLNADVTYIQIHVVRSPGFMSQARQ